MPSPRRKPPHPIPITRETDLPPQPASRPPDPPGQNLRGHDRGAVLDRMGSLLRTELHDFIRAVGRRPSDAGVPAALDPERGLVLRQMGARAAGG